MIKMMPISHQQAFLLARVFYNWAWAVIHNPWMALPPMRMIGILPAAITVSEWKVRAITIKGAIKTIDSSESLTISLIDWDRGDGSDAFYYPATTTLVTSISTGLHEYYVKLSNGDEYISEPFWFNTCGSSGTTGDFSNASPNDDFSNDFWK